MNLALSLPLRSIEILQRTTCAILRPSTGLSVLGGLDTLVSRCGCAWFYSRWALLTASVSHSIHAVVIDGYTSKPYVDPAQPVTLNTSVILVCRVVGVPSGSVLQYAWTCPGDECNIGEGRHPNRRTFGDTFVVNVISFDDAGSYVCSVTEEMGGMLFSVGSVDYNLAVVGKRGSKHL